MKFDYNKLLEKNNSQMRLECLSSFSKNENNWQNVILKQDVVKNMIDQIENNSQYHYVLLFSLEFLEYMVYSREINPSQITFVYDTNIEYSIARKIYSIRNFISSENKDIENIFIKIRESMPDTENLIIVGNPPYQKMDKNNISSGPIYNLFIEESIELNPKYISLIVPSRWFSGGRGLDNFRKKIIQDKRLKSIIHFSDASQIFPDVSIGSGVNYFLWDREYNGLCDFNGILRDLNKYDVVISSNKATNIIDKISNSKKTKDKVCSTGYFGCYRENNTIKNGMKICDENEPNSKICYFRGRQKKYVNNWKDPKNIINKWKVLMGKADGRAYNSSQIDENSIPCKGINNIFIINPLDICTDTYIIVNYFDTEMEAKNFVKYITTKFSKFLIGIVSSTQNFTQNNFMFVPDMEDYTKVWTDKELYELFNLSQEEIDFIESKIL